MSINPDWLCGFFDACGWLDTYNSAKPLPMLVFRSRHRKTMNYLINEFPISHGPFVLEQREVKYFILEITKPEEVLTMLEMLRKSPVEQQRKLADIGFYLFKQVEQYNSDPLALLKARKVAEQLSKEVQDVEFPV
jgi:hypothetical protein